MNTIRMFAFVAAVLITALLFRAIGYGLTVPQNAVVSTSARPQATAD